MDFRWCTTALTCDVRTTVVAEDDHVQHAPRLQDEHIEQTPRVRSVLELDPVSRGDVRSRCDVVLVQAPNRHRVGFGPRQAGEVGQLGLPEPQAWTNNVVRRIKQTVWRWINSLVG